MKSFAVANLIRADRIAGGSVEVDCRLFFVWCGAGIYFGARIPPDPIYCLVFLFRRVFGHLGDVVLPFFNEACRLEWLCVVYLRQNPVQNFV